MNDLQLIQIWCIAILGGVVGAGFLYVRRVEAGPAARHWAWAWISFFLSLIISVGDAWPWQVVSHAAGTGFPALLLAGALVFTGRRLPAWLIPAGFLLGATRGVAAVFGLDWWTQGLVVLVEAPMDFYAAYVLALHARSQQRTPAVAGLAAMYVAFGVFEISNLIFIDAYARTPFPYFAIGGVSTLVMALTQMLVLIERARVRHARDLELLRDIAQTGTLEHDSRGVGMRALELMRARFGLDGGAIWVLRPHSSDLLCVHYFGATEEMPPELATSSTDRPVNVQALGSRAGIFIDDILSRPVPLHPWYAKMGMRSAGILPLQQGGRGLGIISVGRSRVQPFDADEQRILGIVTDELSLVLQHVTSVERLEAERRVLTSVIDTSPTGVLVVDRERHVEILNDTFAQHMGEADLESWLGRPIDDHAEEVARHFEDPEEFIGVFLERSREGAAFTAPITLSDPEEKDLLLFSSPILSRAGERLGQVWVTRDVSEERRLEEQLRQSQKMETLGTLAGGVAHDFNNQLMTILGNSRLLLESEDTDSSERDSLLDIERAAEYCAELTRSLLAFARRTSLSKTSLSPEVLLTELHPLLRSLLPSTIHIELDVPPDIPAVRADATQLQQILLNLVVNARDAVGSDGRIQLACRDRHVGATRSHDARPGHFVEFSVNDNGKGMDAKVRRRVFDPFFTTKPVSEGTGLGLAVVYGAAQAHEGWVEVESKPGVGSTFRVMIPVSDEAPTPRGVEESRQPRASGSETILLADDENMLRRIARIMLEDSGFRVIEAEDGLEAVKIFEKRGGEIDLLLLDVTMPKLDGVAALDRIRELAPTIPAVMMSGLHELNAVNSTSAVTAFLPKPYDAQTLIQEVRSILDSPE
jgi:signal transduction histidine kinase/CheY-like chemotaxis protein